MGLEERTLMMCNIESREKTKSYAGTLYGVSAGIRVDAELRSQSERMPILGNLNRFKCIHCTRTKGTYDRRLSVFGHMDSL
jgi:hypothetical protein